MAANVKTARNFVYDGLGFPIQIRKVTLRKVLGAWAPELDYASLIPAALRALARAPFHLTGDQIRFIRQTHDMTLTQFAGRFGVRHSAVIKWEKRAGLPANINWGTEKDIRLFIFEKLDESPEDFLDLYEHLNQPPDETESPGPLTLSITASRRTPARA
jgi:hypothetical protein